MNKSDLIKAVSEELNFHTQEASNIVSTILDSMTNALANGDNIEIRGFGTFKVRHYDAYIGQNPKTQEKVEVKAKKAPSFRAGKELREAL